VSDAVDFATAAITGAQTAANRDSVLVGAAYSNVRVGAGRRAKTTGADHGREYAQAHTGLLNKWNNSKAHRELTDFLCGLDAPSKIDAACDEDHWSRFADICWNGDSNSSWNLPKAFKLRKRRGLLSQNHIKQGLAHAVAAGIRAEEAVMAKMGNIPPMSAAYLALRERSFKRRQAATLSCVGRLLIENAMANAEALSEGQEAVQAMVNKLHASHAHIISSLPHIRDHVRAVTTRAHALDGQVAKLQKDHAQAVSSCDEMREALKKQGIELQKQLKASEDRCKQLSNSVLHEQTYELEMEVQIAELQEKVRVQQHNVAQLEKVIQGLRHRSNSKHEALVLQGSW
jgi:hypothetical protein